MEEINIYEEPGYANTLSIKKLLKSAGITMDIPEKELHRGAFYSDYTDYDNENNNDKKELKNADAHSNQFKLLVEENEVKKAQEILRNYCFRIDDEPIRKEPIILKTKNTIPIIINGKELSSPKSKHYKSKDIIKVILTLLVFFIFGCFIDLSASALIAPKPTVAVTGINKEWENIQE